MHLEAAHGPRGLPHSVLVIGVTNIFTFFGRPATWSSGGCAPSAVVFWADLIAQFMVLRLLRTDPFALLAAAAEPASADRSVRSTFIQPAFPYTWRMQPLLQRGCG